MTSPIQKREDSVPFHVQLFYRNGGFYRPEEFASQPSPPHISVYTWPDCTLNELALELAAAEPPILPSPSVGTRLAFQLVFPDLRSTTALSNAPPRFAFKDLGSIVIGEGSPGAETEAVDVSVGIFKTLSEARFVVGDYISCAIFPPLSDGSVAPGISPRRDSGMGPRGRGGFRGGFMGRDNGMPPRGNWRDGGGPADFPTGDWSRGERLPERRRGRGRW